MQQRHVVVIGAGPAGLAAAGELGRRGVPAVVLERADAVGASWRGRYDRLRLNSSRWFAALPGARHPRASGMFPSRDAMVAYLEDYASSRKLDVRLGTTVERIDAAGSGWTVRTQDGELDAEHVIVATGHDHTPVIPPWPGRGDYAGRLLHAAAYRNAGAFRDHDVLVVGPGCSGMEIAYDLAQGGAGRVRLAARTAPNIMLRDPLGSLIARGLLRIRPERADALAAKVRLKKLGDLTAYGLPMPAEGPISRFHRTGLAPAIVDKEVVEAIRDGHVQMVAGVEALDRTGALLADGSHAAADAIVAATGYRTALEPLVGHLGVLDERALPRVTAGEAAPGLRFVGFVARPGQIGLMGREATRAAEAIAAGATARTRPALRGLRLGRAAA